MGTENMKICIVSFTKKGYELSCDIAYKLEKSAYSNLALDGVLQSARGYRMRILKIPSMKIIEIPATYHKIYQTGQLHR